MNVQSIPEAPVTNGAGTPHSGPRSTNDALVESALEALGDLAGPPDNDAPARRTVPGKKQPERHTPDAAEDDEQHEEEGPGEGDEEGDEEEPQEPSGEDEVEAHDTRGSKEEPFRVKDLPADKYIELKVDGEKTVVSLKELASGYIREQTFNQRLTKTQHLTEEAQTHAQRFQEERQNLRTATREFLGDAQQLFDYFTATEEREEVLLTVAQRLAAQVRTFRENPEARLEYQRQRDLKRIEEEKQRWQQQKDAEARAQQEQAQRERFERIFKPGWAAGLKRAGFPDVSGKEGQALWDEVVVRLNQRHQSGKPVTSDDVSEFVYRAAKLLELPPKNANARPRPAPAAPPRARTNGTKRDPWADKPKHKRTNDPDYFLRNLRPRDFR